MNHQLDREADLTPQDRQRYARHLVLPSVGEAGQLRLKHSRVLVVGAGGLGSAALLYLAGAGVGRIGIVDDDRVTLSNLQRQVIHGTATLDEPKPDSARRRLLDLNPDIEVMTHPVRLNPSNAEEIAAGYDLVLDGTDNFETRYVINDACLAVGIPYVYGAIFRLEGQASVLCTSDGPCYRCLFPHAPPAESVLTGAEAGILGAIPGVIGTIEAVEAIKHIVGFGQSLRGRLLVFDGAALRFDEIHVEKDPNCPSCGSKRASARTGE
jgi:sulfur-carrier protein adenylyltransferase/sulfurtransferase